MKRAVKMFSVLFALIIACGCGETLPFGPPPEHYPHYSDAVIVGAIVRSSVTGRYTVVNNGYPIAVTEFNGEKKPLADTVEPEELPLLIAAQARKIAVGEDTKEELQQLVSERAPRNVILTDYDQRLYIGPRIPQ